MMPEMTSDADLVCHYALLEGAGLALLVVVWPGLAPFMLPSALVLLLLGCAVRDATRPH